MNWLQQHIHWVVGAAGVWITGNGVLHDIFILLQRRPYEKELIRLLIDGHILIFAGVLFMLCFKPLQENSTFALLVCILNAIFILGYCALIFKMLPAIGIILISLIVLILSIKALIYS
jgi:hypothetical protein